MLFSRKLVGSLTGGRADTARRRARRLLNGPDVWLLVRPPAVSVAGCGSGSLSCSVIESSDGFPPGAGPFPCRRFGVEWKARKGIAGVALAVATPMTGNALMIGCCIRTASDRHVKRQRLHRKPLGLNGYGTGFQGLAAMPTLWLMDCILQLPIDSSGTNDVARMSSRHESIGAPQKYSCPS
jgi:hypothetical protein